jgi:four helix bundle protein
MITTPSTRSTVAPASDSAPSQEAGAALLDAERLDVYGVALEFHAKAAALALRADSVVRDQLRRSSLSVVLNIAEGAGRRSPAQKRHFYSVARGSAMESAATVDVLRVRGVAAHTECRPVRAQVVRIVQMLTKLDQALS